MFFAVVSRHHVSHVHVINLSSSAGRHVLCCCVSTSYFPCTCYRSFLRGRKTCYLLLCLGIMFPMYMLYIFLPRKEDMFFVVVSQHHVTPCTCYRSFLFGKKTCSLLLCLGIMFPMYML